MSHLDSLTGAGIVLLVQTSLLLTGALIGVRLLRSKGPAATALTMRGALVGVVLLTILPFVSIPRRQGLIHVPPAPRVEWKSEAKDLTITKPTHSVVNSSHSTPTHSALLDAAPVESAIPASRHEPGPISLTGVIAYLWAIMSLIFLFGLCCAHTSLALLRRRSAVVKSGAAFERLCRLSGERGLPTPELRTNETSNGPFLMGVVRPTIVMSTSAIEEMDAATLDLIFEHELAHLRNRDCAWRLFERILCALLWLQPLLWWLCLRLDRVTEELCDQVVVANNASRRRYADCLLALAGGSGYTRAARSLGVGVVPYRSQIAKRIAKIMDGSQSFTTRLGPKSRLSICGLMSLFAIAAGLVISGGVPALQSPGRRYPFDKASDPRAVKLWEQMEQTYRDLDSLSGTIETRFNAGGPRKVVFTYKRPGWAIVSIQGAAKKTPGRIVTIEPTQVGTIWPKNPKIYQLQRAEDIAVDAKDGKFLNGFFDMWRGAQIGSFEVVSLLADSPFPPGVPAANVKLGPKKVIDGEIVDTLVVETRIPMADQISHATFYVGTKDHLLRRAEQTSEVGGVARKWFMSEDYKNVRVNPNLSSRDFHFHMPTGAKEVKEIWGPPTYGAGVEAVLGRVADTYRNLKTLSFEAKNMMGTLTVSAKKPNLAKMSLVFPDNIYPDQHSLSDGVNDYVWTGNDPKVYFQNAATPSNIWWFGRAGLTNGGFAMLEAVGWALGDMPKYLVRGEVKLGPSGVLNGVKVDKVTTKSNDSDGDLMPIEGNWRSTTYSFGHDDHLLYQIQGRVHMVVHGTPVDQESFETITHIEADKPLDTDFVFHPGSMKRAKTRAEFKATFLSARASQRN